MPGVFYISTTGSENLVVTVPQNATPATTCEPTVEQMLPNEDPRQLFRVIPSGDGPNAIIQNYDFKNGNGLALHTTGGSVEGSLIWMYVRCDSDDQKWYVQNQHER